MNSYQESKVSMYLKVQQYLVNRLTALTALFSIITTYKTDLDDFLAAIFEADAIATADSTGHTDPSTLEILAATHPGFVQAVRDALPLMRFSAGSVGGHHVRQMVEQNFVFRITQPLDPAPADHTRATRTP